MDDATPNAHRLIEIFERMRQHTISPAFAQLSALNLSLSHIRALVLLAGEERMAMKELADRLHLTPPSVTALTRRLVQSGLVCRQPHHDDSRVVLLGLTDAGRALHHELQENQLRRMARLLSGLNQTEQEQLLDLLDRATRALTSDE